jgi:hypothetical protein
MTVRDLDLTSIPGDRDPDAPRTAQEIGRSLPGEARSDQGLPPSSSPPSAAVEPRAIARLRHGYVVRVEDSGSADTVTLQADDGRLLLRIALTAEGPVLEVQSHALTVATRGSLRLDCQRFEVNAREEVAIRAQRLVQEVRGDIGSVAGGAITSEASAQSHRALAGDLALAAKDDVCVDGGTVRLNSPKDVNIEGDGRPTSL